MDSTFTTTSHHFVNLALQLRSLTDLRWKRGSICLTMTLDSITSRLVTEVGKGKTFADEVAICWRRMFVAKELQINMRYTRRKRPSRETWKEKKLRQSCISGALVGVTEVLTFAVYCFFLFCLLLFCSVLYISKPLLQAASIPLPKNKRKQKKKQHIMWLHAASCFGKKISNSLTCRWL